MADKDTKDTKATSTSKSATPAAPQLAPAAETGDPAVQQLLAELQTATLNGAEDDQQTIRKQLADLGYSA
jgi:hypothetical protein